MVTGLWHSGSPGRDRVLDGERVLRLAYRTNAPDADERVDLDGQTVVPGFTWLQPQPSQKFARIGPTLGWPELHTSAGGAASTVSATRLRAMTSCAPTRTACSPRWAAASKTTTVEIKSGYGLTVVDEARSID